VTLKCLDPVGIYYEEEVLVKSIIEKETLQFLRALKKNNERDWFNKNKDRFVAANANFTRFVQTLIDETAKFDKSAAGLVPKDAVFRIYRDIRFSKDKSPYKTHFGAVLTGRGKGFLAGYYLHVEPGNAFLAGGVHKTEPEYMKAIRVRISAEGKKFLKIINDKNFKKTFTLEGERLVRVQQGFDREDPMAEYLKYKDLTLVHSLDDKKVLSDDFASYCAKIFKIMIPFNLFLNESVKGH
jgi:uncharacterized protein (TIGR02453 family)